MYTQAPPDSRSGNPAAAPADKSTASRTAQDILWESVRGKRLGEIAFRRDMIFGAITVDFFSVPYHLAVVINEPGVSSKHWFYARQDAQLRHMGFRVLRFTHDEVTSELPLVRDSIVEVVSQIARRQRKI